MIQLLLASLMMFSHATIKVAITVDDLPTHGALPPHTSREAVAKKMLRVFQKHKLPDVHAFINAGKVEVNHESYEVLNLWKKSGYSFGNHTYLHPDLNKVSVEEFKKQIEQNEPMLAKLSPTKNWKHFRYPFLREGDTLEKRNAIRSFLKEKNYQIAQVSIDFEDWSWNDPYARCKKIGDKNKVQWLEKTYLQNATEQLDRAEAVSHALLQRSISHILLLHIGAFDTDMLDQLLTAYEKKGVQFITLDEANSDEIYSIDPALAAKYGSEITYQIMKSKGLTLKDLGLDPYTHYPEKELEQVCKKVID